MQGCYHVYVNIKLELLLIHLLKLGWVGGGLPSNHA